MRLKEGVSFRKVELEIDPVKITYDAARAEAKRIQDLLDVDVLKFQYCYEKVVFEKKKRKKNGG